MAHCERELRVDWSSRARELRAPAEPTTRATPPRHHNQSQYGVRARNIYFDTPIRKGNRREAARIPESRVCLSLSHRDACFCRSVSLALSSLAFQLLLCSVRCGVERLGFWRMQIQWNYSFLGVFFFFFWWLVIRNEWNLEFVVINDGFWFCEIEFVYELDKWRFNFFDLTAGEFAMFIFFFFVVVKCCMLFILLSTKWVLIIANNEFNKTVWDCFLNNYNFVTI